MNDMIKRLKVIQAECGGDPRNRNKADTSVKYDEFTRMKRDLALELKEIRQEIKRRNEMKEKGTAQPEIVQLSSKIRSRIRQAQEKATALKQVQQRDSANKKKHGADDFDEHQKRAEAVSLIFSHIQEISELNDETYASRAGGAGVRANVLAPPSLSTGPAASPSYRDPVETELPPIEVQQGLEQLQVTNREIDNELVEIQSGVSVLKDMALEMGKEVELQNRMIEEITAEVDQVDAHLKNINRNLKQTLSRVRKGDKLIMDMVLLCIVLALAGYIYTKLSK